MARQTRGRRGRGLRGPVGLLLLLPLASRAPDYARLLWALFQDERVPAANKALLVGALGYVLVPVDLLPDAIPVLGGLDDLAVLVLGVDLLLESVPDGLLHEKFDELGLDRASFDRDIAQLRRLVPRPVRALALGLPRALDLAADFVRRSGLMPATRRWLTREEPTT